MNRSPMRAAAISWVIACGLLCGGTGVLGTAPAGADPATVGSSPGGAGSDHHDTSGAGRPGAATAPGVGRPQIRSSTSPRRPGTAAMTPSAAADAVDNPGEVGLPNWPWPPWPWPPCQQPPGNGGPQDGVGLPRAPDLAIVAPPKSAGGGSSGGGIGILPRTIPPPGEPGEPDEPGVVSADRGTVDPSGMEPAPITMPPLIELPPLRPAPTAGGSGPAAEPGPRGGPAREPSATRERPPATSSGAGTEAPASSRVGYPKYLREAKIGEVAALALPGFAGLLALTALGGFFGYRQAKAGHVVRTMGTTRFLQ